MTCANLQEASPAIRLRAVHYLRRLCPIKQSGLCLADCLILILRPATFLGICLNTYECRIQNGKSFGPCALGFGVCCVCKY